MKSLLVLLSALLFSLSCFAQDSIATYIELPNKMLEKLTKTQEKTAARIQKENMKILTKLQKQEEKLYKQLGRIDSIKTKELYAGVSEKYKTLEKKVSDPVAALKQSKVGTYIPRMDSLQTMLKFLGPLTTKKEQLSKAMEQVEAVKTRLSQAEDIKKFIGDRQNALKNLTATYKNLPKGLIDKYVGRYSKQCYYYKDRIAGWKEDIKDPGKAEKLALEMLNKLPAFKVFMAKNGELAKLFGGPSGNAAAQSLAGLQTRQGVMQQLQQQMGTGVDPQQYVQQQLQAGQVELQKLKDKAMALKSASAGNGDASMPDFKPNSQKTKPFLKRLDYSFDLQTGAKQYQFPASNDLAISLGYKVNDRFTTGFGIAYKFGLGQNFKNIRFTSDGIGFRSFLEWKISAPKKGVPVLFSNLWLSGGFEKNYWSKFKDIPELQHAAWQESGLIGIAKKVKQGKRELKTQVLWNFLSYKTHATPIVFRVGYSL